MTVKETLIAARALIDTSDKWCDSWQRGEAICAVHALLNVLGDTWPGDIVSSPAYKALSAQMDHATVGTWNDLHTHAEVMAAFDAAISSAPDANGN